jgi:NAD(P)-binding Rossmann-like domain
VLLGGVGHAPPIRRVVAGFNNTRASETSLGRSRISSINGAKTGRLMRVAVIGTGIAGGAAAWTLSKRCSVTVYDRELRPGGHSHTVTIDYDGAPIAVDVGFIAYNELNYPGLTALFDHLGVETIESCMSFAVTADGGKFEWKGGGDNWIKTAIGLFAQPRTCFRNPTSGCCATSSPSTSRASPTTRPASSQACRSAITSARTISRLGF